MKIKAYHKDLGSLHVGCEKPRAYFVPYHSEEAALTGGRDNSERFLKLCGEWNFKFYNSFEDIGADFLNAEFTDSITVPKCWQVELGKGYDVPLYSNLFYPFPLDPPYVPDENPAGHYNRKFSLEKKADKKYFINFSVFGTCAEILVFRMDQKTLITIQNVHFRNIPTQHSSPLLFLKAKKSTRKKKTCFPVKKSCLFPSYPALLLSLNCWW